MPTLDWIGKKAVMNHDKQVPFHLLNVVPELSYGDKDSAQQSQGKCLFVMTCGENFEVIKELL